MAESEIFREQTVEEKKDFVNILNKDKNLDVYGRFKKKAEQAEQAKFKKFEPYCFRCAKIDFEKKLKDIVEESKLNLNDDVKIDGSFDYEKYGDSKRFRETKRTEVTAQDKRYALPVQITIGHNIDYICKIRGCGITIYKPIDVKDTPMIQTKA